MATHLPLRPALHELLQGWALGPAFSGWWREQVGFTLGFNTVFTLMTALYIVSILLLYAFFVRGRAESRVPGLPHS